MKTTPAMVKTVLVTDSDRNSAVSIIQSLGRAGWRVIAADSKARSLGFCSRYTHDRLVYPEPESAAHRFVDVLHRTVVEREIDLVIPVTDEVIHPLVHQRQRFESICQLAIPETTALERVTDKSKTMALAEGLGVPVPPTFTVRTVEEAHEAASSLRWPLVVKPAISRRFDHERGMIAKYSVSYANSLEELTDQVRDFVDGQEVLLQEYCGGVGYGVEILACNGGVLAAFQHKRLAEVPLSGGVSAWRESVPLDPELYGHALRLVESLRWTGLIMVEFKVGEQPWLMEINGRVWGSLPLAVLSGMDFPARLAEMYSEGVLRASGEPATDYRIGLRAYDLELMLKWVVRVMLGRRKYSFLPIPPRREALAAIFGLLDPRQKRDLGFRGDFRPALGEIIKVGRKFGSTLWARTLKK